MKHPQSELLRHDVTSPLRCSSIIGGSIGYALRWCGFSIPMARAERSAMAVSNFVIQQALRGQDITIYGNCKHTRSFCYVDDLIHATVRMMNTPDDFTGPVNVGNPREFTVLELAEQGIELTGSRSKLVSRPLPDDDPRQRQPDIPLVARRSAGRRGLNCGREGLRKPSATFGHGLDRSERVQRRKFDRNV